VRSIDVLSQSIALNSGVVVAGIRVSERRHPERAPEEPAVLLLPGFAFDPSQLREERWMLLGVEASNKNALASRVRVRATAFLQQATGFAK